MAKAKDSKAIDPELSSAGRFWIILDLTCVSLIVVVTLWTEFGYRIKRALRRCFPAAELPDEFSDLLTSDSDVQLPKLKWTDEEELNKEK